jgi:hypothetical protein
MRDYFDQVRRVAQTDLYFVTLGAALAIPDMCAGMDAPDGRTSGARYVTWFDKHVAPKYTAGPAQTPSLSGDDCYGLRCAMLHQGRLQPHKGSYSRIVFFEPHGGIILHNNVMNDVLNIDVRHFALDMVESAEAWLVSAENTTNYHANYAHFMQRYPQGLPPYIGGIPVIA